LAKPFHWSLYDDSSNNFEDGIDIIIAMDVSGSMMAIDFVPNRLEASKKVAMEFVDGRKGDRIGLVVYGERAYTACPATLDYEVLKKQIKKISMDPRIGGNTAIGTGLGTSVTRLREDKKSGKVIILLTDGRNNAGDITPIEAAELAKEKNIRVYTIGLGSKEDAMSPQNSVFGTHFQSRGSDIDEETLKKIAKMTNGQYFRATDKESLKEIYKEIEKLETREMEGMRFKSEPPAHPQAFLNWAFVLAMISFGVKMILFRNSD
jgi:Ca-activated chloride channel family protein